MGERNGNTGRASKRRWAGVMLPRGRCGDSRPQQN